MRFSILSVLIVTSLPFVTPHTNATSVFELCEKIFEISEKVFQISVSFNNDSTSRENFAQLDVANVQIAETEEKMNAIKRHVNVFVKMVRNLSKRSPLGSSLKDIRLKQYYLNSYYKNMMKYVTYFNGKANLAHLNFADRVLSGKPNSVTYMMDSVYKQVLRDDFMQRILDFLKPAGTGYYCTRKESPSQMLHTFFNEIFMMNTKSYIMMNTAYIFKKFHGKGDFKNEIKYAYEEFKIRNNNLVATTKSYLQNSSSELWRCDPDKHVSGATFIELKHFLHGFILNKANLDPKGKCNAECETFSYTKLGKKCNNDNAWCNKEQPCRKVVDCRYIDKSMTVCPSKFKDNRRYEYVQFGNGRIFGKKKHCSAPLSYLETYLYWIIYRCSYCFCICDEYDKYYTERTINLRLAMSNTADNKVVTGLRFVKHKKIIHLQIQEGKLLPFGQVDPNTVRWVPPEDYSKLDKSYREDEDYHVFSWENRAFDLADIMADNGTVITGVKFRKVGTRLHLEVQLTPFDFTTGRLKYMSFLKHDPNIESKHSSGKELKLVRSDIPTRLRSPSTQFTTDKYVQFTNTDYDKDAGQTTVPFFDAQPVESTIPVPLSGVGLFHKGSNGYGGFLTPRIFTYRFWQHLKPVFPSSRNDD